MKNILVTGGAGYIGSHTSQKLIDSGFKVVVFDNISTGFEEAVPNNAKFIKGDVRDQRTLSQVLKENEIHAVIHFAAKLNVAESLKIPTDYYDNNTAGVVSLAKSCSENSIRHIVFSSTAAVYGDKVQNGLINEESAKAPINPYGRSKLFSEQILKDLEISDGIQTVVLRYFNVAGASIDGSNGQRTANAYHLVHLASMAAVGKRDKLSIFGTDYPTPDGTCLRDYIHVEDLADTHVLSLRYLLEGGNSDTFNCGYGIGYSVRDIIDTMKRVSKVDFPVDLEARRPGDPASLVADNRKIILKLGWEPKRKDLDIICKSAFEWESKR